MELAAYTMVSVLQTMVVFCPDVGSVGRKPDGVLLLLDPETALYPVWHAFDDWQTLQPKPDHPFSHVHDDAVKFANPPPGGCGAVARLVPWKMVPPQEG